MWSYTIKLPSPFIGVLNIMAFFFSWAGMYCLGSGISVIYSLDLVRMGAMSMEIPIIFDGMSLIFIALVSYIGANVLSFSKYYMEGERDLGRFYGLLLGFIVSMWWLILSPNYFSMLVGWDGLGMSSVLLVIYYQDKSSLDGGWLTVLTNRLGDGILLVVIGLMSCFGEWSMLSGGGFGDEMGLVNWEEQLESYHYIMVSILVTAAWTKSAQTPFHTWLPAAMAAPTPVSTLVHSSTLVTAGVYIMIRFYPWWSSWPVMVMVVTGTGLGTMAAGGGLACTEPDVKKIIAYSTLSQLGFMMAIMGLGFPMISFFHLVTHALFKATLFMSAGVMFMLRGHRQTVSNWSGRMSMPLASVGMVMSLASMNAMPFFAGFYSKEMILEWGASTCLWVAGALAWGSGITATYSARLWRGLVSSATHVKAYAHQHSRLSIPVVGDSPLKGLHLPFCCMLTGLITVGSVAGWSLMSPVDYSHSNILIKLAIVAAFVGGLGGALMPCKSITKYRSTQAAGMMSWGTYSYKVGGFPLKTKSKQSRRGARTFNSVITNTLHWSFVPSFFTWVDCLMVFDRLLLEMYSGFGMVESFKSVSKKTLVSSRLVSGMVVLIGSGVIITFLLLYVDGV